MYTPSGDLLSDLSRVLPMYALPHHALSRIVHRITRSKNPAVKDYLIQKLIRHHRIKLDDVIEPDTSKYESFNAFFTRGLKPDARPLTQEADGIASPVDGTVSQAGRISSSRVFQAKGHDFSVVELLGGLPSAAAPFYDGIFTTLYLAPRDYHRIHMPFGGTLKRMTHIPGRLFPVHPASVRRVPRLFARNERVACIFDTDAGPMAVVLVGALFVGSIETVWAGEVTPPMGSKVTHTTYSGDEALYLKKGDELGRFNMGSTVIVMFGRDRAAWVDALVDQTRLQMGELIGRARRP
ncbi:MAG: archaetidylserine decarboxylase [Xanthomonadaceae bacterium]|nr:archaetidylserine decarboxylase [Xanthomonadaceae bacterium]